MLTSVAAQAQIADVSTPRPLLRGVQSGLYHPVLSADGSRLLITGADYSGLRMYDYNLGTTVTITSEARAGYNAQFAGDGIAFTASTADGHVARYYDIADGTTVTKSAPAARAAGRTVRGAGNLSVSVDGSDLIIARGNRTVTASPVEAVAYLWPTLSPDGSKVAFVAAGKGLYVTDLEGKVLGFCGDLEAPAWLGNDCLVAMRATDDGHQLASSQIVLVRADGSESQDITRPESMTMYPTASAVAGKIVYSTVDGYLYEVDVTIR